MAFNFGGSTTPAAGGFSFGGTSTTPAAGGFGFGASTAATTGASTGGFSFGNTAAAAAPSTGGLSFGGTSTGTTGTSAGLSFGGTTATSGFGFGAASVAPASTGSGFGFGAAKPAVTSSFGFGASTGTNLTGFGTTSAFGGGGSGSNLAFGGGQGGMMGTNNFQLQNGSSDGTMEDLAQIRNEYGICPKNIQHLLLCRLKAIAFKVTTQDNAQQYKKPTYYKETEWRQAIMQANRLTEHLNPADNKERVVPTPLIGFKQLLQRINMQDKHCGKLIHMLAQLQTKVQKLKKRREKIKQAINERLSNQQNLSQRLMQIMEQVAVIQAGTHPLTSDEVRFRDILEVHHQNFNSPTQFKAKLNEVMYLQRMQQKQRAIMVDDLTDADAENVCSVLDKQREGLELLTNKVREDRDDLDVMLNVHRTF